MKKKEIRKFLLDNYKCVKDVVIMGVINSETLEYTGSWINVYLDDDALYQLNWLIDLQNKIGADDCLITTERNSLKVKFKIKGE